MQRKAEIKKRNPLIKATTRREVTETRGGGGDLLRIMRESGTPSDRFKTRIVRTRLEDNPGTPEEYSVQDSEQSLKYVQAGKRRKPKSLSEGGVTL